MEEGSKTQQEKVDILLQLPLEVALHILSYCRAHDLLQFQLVCSAWASLAKEEEAWKQLVHLTRPGATLPSPDIKSWRDFYMTLRHDPVYVTCVSIGDVGVGKTSMLKAYIENSFSQDYTPTVYQTWETSTVALCRKVQLAHLDTPCQPEYDRFRILCYKDVTVFMICFSVVDESSFDSVTKKWIPEIQLHCPRVPFILVGTKTDLRGGQRNADQSDALQVRALALAKQYNTKYCECSALTQSGLIVTFYETLQIGTECALRKPVPGRTQDAQKQPQPTNKLSSSQGIPQNNKPEPNPENLKRRCILQ